MVDSFVEGLAAGWGRVGKRKLDEQQKRLASAETEEASRKAEDIFMEHHGERPTDPFSPARRRKRKKKLLDRLKALQRPRSRRLTYAQAVAMGETLAPALAELDEIWLYEEQIRAGTVYVPARGAAGFAFAGYCLDQDLPAPSHGDRLRLFPLERVADEKTARVLGQIGRLSLSRGGPGDGTPPLYNDPETQYLVWALRGMQIGEQWHLSNSHKRVLADLDPEHFGGLWSALDGLARNVGQRLGSDLRKSTGPLADITALERTRERMRELERNAGPVSNPTGSPYTLLHPGGVAVRAEGTGPLAGAALVHNNMDQPLILDPYQFVGESLRMTQRILVRRVIPILDGTVSWLASPVREALQVYDRYDDDEISQKLGETLFDIGTSYTLAWLPGAGNSLFAKSAGLIKLLEAAPFLGNAISAVELACGMSWTEFRKPPSQRQPMNSAERLLALAGTIPGAGSLIKRFPRSEVAAVLQKASAALNSHRGEMTQEVAKVTAGLGVTVFEKAAAEVPASVGTEVQESIAQITPLSARLFASVSQNVMASLNEYALDCG